MIFLLACAFLFGFLAGSIAMAWFIDRLIKRSRAAADQDATADLTWDDAVKFYERTQKSKESSNE